MRIKTTLAVLAADKLKLALGLAAVTTVAAAGVTFGSWTISGSGNAYSKAVTSSNLTLSDASAFTVADLYPGASGNVKVRVTNPNAFAVTITTVTGTGAISSDVGATCDGTSGMAFTDQTGLSLALAGGATTTFTLTGAASMGAGSPTACIGAIFTIPVSVAATT